MYQAIVFLPLLGAILAGIIALAGARARCPGGEPSRRPRASRPRMRIGAHAARRTRSHRRSRHGPAEPAGARLARRRDHHHVVSVHRHGAVLDRAVARRLPAPATSASPLFTWMVSGDFKVDWALRIDALTAVMLVVVTTVSALVHLYSIGYMAEDPYRPRFFAYLSFFTFAMLALVTSDNLAQLFFGWEGVGLASYLLIGFWYHKPEANAAAIKAFIVNRVGDFGFALGIFAVFMMTGVDRLRHRVRAGARAHRQDHQFLRLAGRRADADLPAPVHGRDGQVGAVPAAHLAAGRDGRPDPGLGADPCRHHGDGRRVHGGAALAAVRACAERAGRRDAGRRHHRVLRRDRRPRAERHQADRRLFDLLAARLHVRRHGRWRLFGRHVPPVHARVLQGAAVPRLRLGDHGDAPRAGHPEHGRAEEQDPVHLLDHGDRHAGADRLPAHRRLFLQGRDHRGGVRRQEPVRALRLPCDGGRPRG